MEARTNQGVQPTGARLTWTGIAKAAAGIVLVVALIQWGHIDFGAVARLVGSPAAVLACAALVFAMIPLGALRWAVILRAFDIPLPFARVFHYFAVGTVLNLFMLGTVGGDSLRTLLAWRTLGRGGAKVAISVAGDRIAGLLALMTLALLALAFNWRWVQSVAALAALGTFLALAYVALIGGIIALAAAPGLVEWMALRLSRWPRLASLVLQVQDVARAVRNRPGALLVVFGLALAIQSLGVLAVLVIAGAIDIGQLTAADYMFAVPITLVANALPLTPNGLGVGEATFDQLCRWLEPVPTGAAYSSIFFAFRAVSMFGMLCGLVSFAIPQRGSSAVKAAIDEQPVREPERTS
jgi:uncharacterized protein (TIRG00374 family)